MFGEGVEAEKVEAEEVEPAMFKDLY